ncbi:uncharacterized protein [Amphiura filiformis]|uniref:uncharacterized protein n=1 Tax=Amphiura filiformis TaxID=82378 RepID=UPI003B21BC10
MSAPSVANAVTEFSNILERLHGSLRDEFCKKVEEIISETAQDEAKEDKILRCIAEKIRQHPNVPVSAVVNTETVIHPSVGEFSDLDPSTVVSLDNFLYEDDDAIDDLCEQGLISRNFCLDCGSHKTAPLNFISHSASLLQLKFVFQHALPDLRGKTLVDVGSRLGVVLYGAYYYSSAKAIIGVEINQQLCSIQNDMIKEFQLDDRVQVLCADVCTKRSLLEKGDVIVLHNVFEFFAAEEVQIKIWKFLREVLQTKGMLLVTVPSLAESLQHLQTDIDLDSWVRQIPLDYTDFVLPNEEDRDQLERICLYEVIG